MAVIGYLNGLSWVARIGWEEVAVGLFVLAVSYAISFHFYKTRIPWLLAATICVLLADAIAFRLIIRAGLILERFAITSLEWFVTGSVAGVLTMVTPEKIDRDPRNKRPYY